MKQTIIIGGLSDLHKFKKEFHELINVVRKANGKYVLYVETHRPESSANSMLISKEEFDRVVSPTMYGTPRAFSKNIAGGKFLPERLDAVYGAVTRAQAQKAAQERGKMKVLNRKEYMAYYFGDFSFYPKLGAGLNASVKRSLLG